MRAGDTPIDRAIVPALKAVARKAPFFTKREVLHEVLRKSGTLPEIQELRKSFPGTGFDVLVLRYIDSAVGRALQARDPSGIRLYECYSVDGSERRWMRFRDMRARNIREVLNECYALSAQIAGKIRFYELVLKELESKSADATVDEIYDAIVMRRQLIQAENAEAERGAA